MVRVVRVVRDNCHCGRYSEDGEARYALRAWHGSKAEINEKESDNARP